MGPRLTDEEIALAATTRGSIADPFAHDSAADEVREDAIDELERRGYDRDEAEDFIDEYEPPD